jgi:hypothetical protein
MQRELDHPVRPFLPTWAEALGDESGAMFRELVAPDVRLEGSVFATPVDGRENVWTTMHTGGGITDKLTFTHESTTSDRLARLSARVRSMRARNSVAV